MECIFVDRPKECGTCLRLNILECLLNKQHLKVSDEGKQALREALENNVKSLNRYKTKSGEEGRHREAG